MKPLLLFLIHISFIILIYLSNNVIPLLEILYNYDIHVNKNELFGTYSYNKKRIESFIIDKNNFKNGLKVFGKKALPLTILTAIFK